MNYGAVILAGGQSRRMGESKAKLKIDGKRFLDRLAEELCGFGELLVSVDEPARHPDIAYPMVGDVYPGCGPMAGLHAALSACRADALLALSCDLPLFERALGERLCALMDGETDVVAPLSDEGWIQLQCAVYRRSCAPVFEKFLTAGNYRIRDALAELRVKTVRMPEFSRMLTNVNTREDYEKLLRKEGNQ